MAQRGRGAWAIARRSPLHWLTLLVASSLALILTFYPSTEVSFQLEGEGVYQIFYDGGNGFSEADSVWRNGGTADLSGGGLSARAFRIDPAAGVSFSVCAPTRNLRWLPGLGTRTDFEPTPSVALGMVPLSAPEGCASWRAEAEHPDPQVVFMLPAAPGGAALAKGLSVAKHALWTIAFFALVGSVRHMSSVERQRIGRYSSAVHARLDRRLPQLFLVIGLTLGLGFIVVRPPGAVPDEFAHASKIALMSAGQLVGADEGRERPQLLGNYGPFQKVHGQKFSRDELAEVATAPLACDDVPRQGVAAPAGASPLMYLPPWIGHTVTCRIEGDFGLYYYGSQFVNLLLYLALGFVGLKAAGFGRWALFVIASVPMSFYLATSLSYDANMLALCIAYLGIVSGVSSGRLTTTGRAQWGLLGLGVLLALSKPLMGWIFFAPWVCLAIICNGWSQRLRWLFITSLIPAAIHAVWIFRLSSGGEGYVRPDVESVNGMGALVAAPLVYLKMLVGTAFSNTGQEILQGVVGVFGWLDIYPPDYFYSISALAIFGALALNSSAKPSGFRTGVFAWGIVLMVIVIMCIPFYAFWTPPGSPVIQGLQGRYFIPLAAFVAMLCSFSIPTAWRGPIAALVVLSVPVMSAIAFISILSRYY